MFKKIICLSIIFTQLSACTNDPSGYLKKSANNKLFDTRGFNGEKRAPLYNKKYIHQAKKNIIKGDYETEVDEDYDEEGDNISRNNIEVYKELIRKDLEEERKRKRTSRNSDYPSILSAKNKLYSEQYYQNLELKEELEQIKLILDETRKELETKCSNCVSRRKDIAGQIEELQPEIEQLQEGVKAIKVTEVQKPVEISSEEKSTPALQAKTIEPRLEFLKPDTEEKLYSDENIHIQSSGKIENTKKPIEKPSIAQVQHEHISSL